MTAIHETNTKDQNKNKATNTNSVDDNNNLQITKNVDVDVEEEYKIEFVWPRIIIMIVIHGIFLYGIYSLVTEKSWVRFFQLYTYWILMGALSSIGITAGSHRLWTHRTYKAKLPLRIILMICQTMAHQNSILEWSRDHRVHHKFTDTNADPHNSRRGFWFSHIGWLLIKKHPEVKNKGKTIDMSDVASDPVVQFQEKYFYILMPMICFVLPALVPYYFFGQTLFQSFIGSMTRYVLTLNLTWSINSVAHLWGDRPYDKIINPCDNWFVVATTIGEGFHNYHHVFPWDYKCSEFGSVFNSTKTLLDFFGKIGWAYDMKSVSEEMIRRRVLRTGDGTHELSKKMKDQKIDDLIKGLKVEKESEMFWGWDDKDIPEEDVRTIVIVNKKEE